MALIRRRWPLAAADEWAREDWITIVLSALAYIGLTGVCDLAIVVPSNRTSRIQEAHIIIGPMMCQYIEEESSGGSAG